MTKNSQDKNGLLTMFYIPMFNFLCDRGNPTFYDIFFPHTVGTVENQEKIVDDIRGRKVAFTVTAKGVFEPSDDLCAASRFGSYGRDILRFVRDNYHVVEKSGPFLFLKINGAKGPLLTR
jgi:hypothetical protein